MKILLIPDSFKGSLSSARLCAIMKKAALDVMPDAQVTSIPAADGGELPFERMTQASNAIIHSDNDSADALWDWAGRRPAYDALASDLGLKDTHSAPEKDFWSWTWTTPNDQRSFLHQLVRAV